VAPEGGEGGHEGRPGDHPAFLPPPCQPSATAGREKRWRMAGMTSGRARDDQFSG
jgi:hypothetical protein